MRRRRKKTRSPTQAGERAAATRDGESATTPGELEELANALEWLVQGYAAAELVALRRPPFAASGGWNDEANAGELPIALQGVRPLRVAFLRAHVRRRLRLIRRLLELEDVGGRWHPSAEPFLARVDEAVVVWGMRPVASMAGRWLLPLLGAAGGLAPVAAVAADASRTTFIVVISVSVFVSLVVAGSFAGKRACLLDVSPIGTHNPLPTNVYGLEARVLGLFAVAAVRRGRREDRW